MSKISLNNIVNLQNETTAVNAINANNTALTTAMNNTLSRDGTQPNSMGADLDMDSNRILNLPTAVSTVEPVTLAQMTAALAANGNINTGLTGVPVSAAMQPVVAASTITAAQALLEIPTPYIDSTLYGVVADGVTDCSAFLQAAVNAAAGMWVQLPVGVIVLKSQVNYITNTLWAPGLKLRGFGPEKTIIDNQVPNNSCIYTAGASNLFQLGSIIKDFSIKTTTSPVSSNGIEHLACYNYIVDNLYIHGLTGDGIRVTANIGDADASNMMWYRNCLLLNNSKGINCNFAANVVQPSFMRIENCDIQGHAVGLRWIGLSGMVINSGFAVNTIGLQIADSGSSNAQFTSIGTSFENNGTHIITNRLTGATFIATELANTAPTLATTQAVVLNNSFQVRFADTRVRISATPHTLWTIDSSSTGNIIENSFYANYDNAGQVRYSYPTGVANTNRLDDSFESIQNGQANGVYLLTLVNGSNENVALPLTGAVLTASGPTGAFSIGGLTNGFDGRRLTLVNMSGQIMTIKSEDASSTAANRLRADNLTDVTVNAFGSVVFVYHGVFQRWFLVGKG